MVNIRQRLEFCRVSYSCDCTAGDVVYEIRGIVVIAAPAYDFENSHRLRCAGLSESTKMRRRMVEMCVTVILLIKYVEIKKTWANERSTILAFTDHISLGTS